MVEAKFNIFVYLRSFVRKFNSGMKAADRNVQKFQGNLKNFEKRTNMTATSVHKLGMKFNQMINTFRMWALGVMFFGMMIQRIFLRILKTGITTFTQIQESMGFTGSAIQQVSAMFKYLGFIVGSVINRYLTPLLPVIWKIVRTIKRWIEDNPELTAKIILWGLAIGTLLMLFGSFTLGLWSIAKMFTVWAGAIKWIALKALPFLGKAIWFIIGLIWKILVAIVTVVAGILGIPIWLAALIIAIVVALVLAIIFNVWGIRDKIVAAALWVWDFIEPLVMAVWNLFKEVALLIWEIILLVKDVIVRIFQEIWDFMVEIFGPLVEWINENLWIPFKEAMQKVWDWIKEKLDALGTWIKEKIQWAADLINMITGAVSAARGLVGRARDWIRGGRQFGGNIPATGLYRLHAGEQVIPANKVNNFGGMTVNINTTGGVNGNQVAREILKEIKRYTNVYID